MTRERLPVFVSARDPILYEGTASMLQGQGVELVDQSRLDADVVALVVVDEVDESLLCELGSIKDCGVQRLVLVVRHIDDAGLRAAVEAGVGAIVRRTAASPPSLEEAITTCATGGGALPADLLGSLLEQVSGRRSVAPGARSSVPRLTEREAKVMELLADGLCTAEVGRELYQSERNVKHIVHRVTSRLNVRNRTHAVAYSIRNGLI